ncbi:hypothetical protein M2150_000763 [Lachnospiraceae bacterium PM6-15]|uniref:DUF3783 domain-containing protein n=1 Tax=Ohessyouella blattaphilus TaxID=2949333 RepID=UPI003E18D4D3
MEAKLLCFNLAGTEKGAKLERIFTFLGYQVVHVGKENYGQTLERLIGLAEIEKSSATNGDISEEMLVIHASPEMDLDQALFLMKEEGVQVALKAMTTPNNLSWTAAELFKEISKEREMIQQMNANREGKKEE